MPLILRLLLLAIIIQLGACSGSSDPTPDPIPDPDPITDPVPIPAPVPDPAPAPAPDLNPTPLAGINDWTWMSGNKTIYLAGRYGTRGVADPANNPGERTDSHNWTDNSGNLWMFGGAGVDAEGRDAWLNDLWRFDGTNWTWVSGSKLANHVGVYGEKGIAAANNIPGARHSAATWLGPDGNLWLYGGDGYSKSSRGKLHDLWKFNITSGQWTWVAGDELFNKAALYGVKGTSDAANTPPGLYSAMTWTDENGKLWLFGGVDSLDSYNDLWQFDISSGLWTWVSGDGAPKQVGHYGTKGVASLSTLPGSRSASTAWATPAKLWLFGGLGYATTFQVGSLNDLWSYDIANDKWTWVSGSDTTSQAGVYGSKGIASASNVPGGRSAAAGQTDGTDKLWLFGGSPLHNDLWQYTISTNMWTWVSGSKNQNESGVYGEKGLATPGELTNSPGARASMTTWIDLTGNLWLFGGFGQDIARSATLNDLWQFDGTYWRWVTGDDRTSRAGNFASLNVPAASNLPSARSNAVNWVGQNDEFWMYGGYGHDASGAGGLLTDLWHFDGSDWTWVNGSNQVNQPANYGFQGEAAAANNPGARTSPTAWTDKQGQLWLFGGRRTDQFGIQEYLNDLWTFDPTTKQWIWVAGPKLVNQSPVYNETDPALNNPGGRYASMGWIDSSDNLWLFGGTKYQTRTTSAKVGDLWQYNITSGHWAWMGGSQSIEQAGTYGDKGVAAEANVPGARSYATTWKDDNDNFWLFGGSGYGYDSGGLVKAGTMNDLWKYDNVKGLWTWVSGSNILNQNSISGAKGVASTGYAPGARYSATGWTDGTGRLWLFGGSKSPMYNDLWHYNTVSTEWTRVSGDITPTSFPGIYGSQGFGDSINNAGARTGAMHWMDSSGQLWLFGGNGIDAVAGNQGYLNDLWRYRP